MSTSDNTDAGGAASMRGVAVGIVTDNQDPENMGRVKVTYPWRDDDGSVWARVATAMAGNERGTYFIPEVDDEVLVAFADGNVRYPYVIGGLWNGQDAPPGTNEGNNDVRKVTSRSGHELVFDDAKQSEKVEITTSGGHSVVLDDSSGSETITITDSKDQNSIEFDATQGSLDITGGTELTIEAPTVEITGKGSLKLESDGILEINGSLVKIN
ncbi:phage baseplate assembly protein V [Halosimplex amylolyticum]|uniref:phage baseplate assembly protein V n=1 Tax=Halosimplex amylolyticum TaxID=3396616 RepID=UPI003F56E2F8